MMKVARGMVMARGFHAKVRAGVIDLEDDEEDGPDEKERFKRSRGHIGRLPIIQGPHLRGYLNRAPGKT